MAEAVVLLIRGLFILSFLSMGVGLISPVLVLWFLDRFNRLKVLKIYGTMTVFFFLFYKILGHFLLEE